MSENQFINTAQQHIEDNLLNGQFGVEELAELMNMSRANLHRRLKSETGTSISQFIREYRLKRSYDLMLIEDLTMAEVAFKVGFNSASYFSRAFHDFYGFPPNEARIRGQVSPSVTKPTWNFSRRNLIIGLIVCFGLLSLLLFWPDRKVETFDAQIKLAVLPFRNLSADVGNQYFADGMMEAIVNKLAGIQNFKVISRTSVERYRDTNATISEISEDLGVAYVLTGSIQKQEQQIRCAVQLIQSSDDTQLWSREFEFVLEDVFRVQTDMAIAISKELGARFSKKKEKMKSTSTENTAAYNLYLQGLFQRNLWTNAGFDLAIPLFQKALALDSLFIEPYIELGRIYSFGGTIWGFYNRELARNQAVNHLSKALTLDPDNENALDLLACTYFYYDWDLEKASELYLRINQLTASSNPANYGVTSTDFFLKIGEFDLSRRMSELMIEEDPTLPPNYTFYSNSFFMQGDTSRAIQILDDTEDFCYDFFYLRESTKLFFNYDEKRKSKERLSLLLENFSERPPIVLWLQAVHSEQESELYLKELVRCYEEGTAGSPAWFLALYYAGLGETDQSLDWLEKSFDKREIEMTWLFQEPLLKKYQAEPRYVNLLESMGFMKFSFRE